MKWILVLLAFTALLSTGCMGLLINGSSQEISIDSVPRGAEVRIDGGEMGITPLTVDLSRGESHQVQVLMDGYEDASFSVSRSADGGVIILDILFTGGIGILIDMGTGAMYKLSPENLFADLDENVSIHDNCITVNLAASGE